ncbi:putative leucine-rich repeat receptor-like protein kinase [Vitis vinifera]|uniref:Putative leucine-rich repeat receptor-like protein kinase n=1 Tax=Vitis vinifera TaxID=29760 RepID=A0A438BRL9_VITVI|nr:putative leucine-rich repeat receptor-like protein kinase [Vitis vinifera]
MLCRPLELQVGALIRPFDSPKDPSSSFPSLHQELPRQGLNSEGKLLLELKHGLYDQFNHLYNWNPSDQTPCGWIGVNCTGYDPVVISLDLNSMNLSGTLSPSIGGLSYLTYLMFLTMGLLEIYPRRLEIIECMPITNCLVLSLKEIGNLYALVELVAYTNNLTEIGGCRSLRYLGLAQNDLAGEIPKEIGDA